MKLTAKLSSCLLVLGTLFATEAASKAQVNFTVNPSTISSTYPGVVTLNITGLTNGETIYLAKWLDLNGNGSIDPGEPLVDAFQLKDNNNSYAMIGGVTNVNVPIDQNPTNGVITTTLSFPSGMILENCVGHFVYEIFSSTGRFAPVTAAFAITNSALPQSISGTVFQSDGITPMANAVVVLQDNFNNNVAASIVSDSNGHYSISLYPGEYQVIAGMPNFYTGFGSGPSVTLTNGMSATNQNLYMTNGGPNVITGSVLDANSSNGIPGLMLLLQSGSLFEVAFTDTNGAYSASVPAGFWAIQVVKERLARRAYVFSEAKFQVDATAGSVSNANIFLPPGNAMFYGNVSDNLNNPFVNVEVDSSIGGTVNNSFDAKGYADTNGNYSVVTLADTNQYEWACDVNNGDYGSNIRNFIMNFNDTVVFSPGQAVRNDFVGIPATATVSGNVHDNTGSNVVGVTLTGNASINGKNYTTLDATTDGSGNYVMTLAAGNWQLQFLNGGFMDNLDAHGYEDPISPHYVNVPPTNQVLNFTVYPLGTPYFTSSGFTSPGHFGFNVYGSQNVSYTVQVSSTLAANSWSNVYSFLLTNSPMFITDPSATNAPRYYRVVKSP